jgi:urea transport system permease protein
VLALLLAIAAAGLTLDAQGAAGTEVPALRVQSSEEQVRSALAAVGDASFVEKEALAERIAASGYPRSGAILTAWLEDRLYRRADGRVVIVKSPAEEQRPSVPLLDPLTFADIGSAAPADLTKVGTNNRLRRALRTAGARFALAASDPSARRNAVVEMSRSLDEATVTLLRQRAAVEPDAGVKREIETALAYAALDGGDAAAQLAAIRTLSTRSSSEVRNRLAALVDAPPGGAVHGDADEVHRAARAALADIDSRRRAFDAVETLFFGLSLGSVLVLVAIGLAITFGVMGVINMAHGELMMLGAYTTYVVQLLMPSRIELSIFVAVPAAFLATALIGILIERTIIRFLYGRPLETLLATFGVSLILQQLVRSVFSANNRAVETPAWMSGTLQVNDALALTYNRLYIVIFTAAVFTLLLVVLRHTPAGLRIRAVAQNRSMARALGVRSDWVDAMTFGLGAGIAGVAGVALSQLTNVGPNLGQSYVIDSFMVVVFGGVGNLWGTLIGGLTLGIVNKVLEPYSGAVLGKIFVLIGLIVFIQRRPRGLFPQTGRAAEGMS